MYSVLDGEACTLELAPPMEMCVGLKKRVSMFQCRRKRRSTDDIIATVGEKLGGEKSCCGQNV